MPGKVVCFGEVLLRLSAPAGELLLQSARLEARIGGAEANVAVSLARFGHEARMVSFVPDQALGRMACAELRRHGVEASGVRAGPGRMGLYFLTPAAGLRAGEVIYDRAGSSFALAAPDAVDWDAELAGAGWLHVTGVTAAVSGDAGAAALRAVRAAKGRGVGVSFDVNYRRALWQARRVDGARILAEIAACADLLIAGDRDIGLMLGSAFDEIDPLERRRAAADAAFTAFPDLACVASTLRVVESADRHQLTGFLADRTGAWSGGPRTIAGIVDRVGSGDAFAAGLIHARLNGRSPQDALEFALAASAIKHSMAGDFSLASVPEVEALLAGAADVTR